MKETTYLFIYCTSGATTVLKNLSYSQLTTPGWWLDCFIDSFYRDLDDPIWNEALEKSVSDIVATVKKELETKSSVTIFGNYGYLTICESNTVINLNTDIL